MAETAVPPSTRTKRKAFHARKIDPAKVRELHKKGLNYSEIARHQGVAPSSVWRFLEREKPERIALERFKEGRADEFAALQGKALAIQHLIMDSILKDGIPDAMKASEKAMLMNSLNNVQGTIYDKERLERGQSTENVSVMKKLLGSAFDGLHNPANIKEVSGPMR